MKNNPGNNALALSFIAVLLICVTSFSGLFLPEFYEAESSEWQLQCKGQDFINLFVIIPVFVVVSLLSLDQKPYGPLLWAGCLLYFVYTYLIYCFDIHFNAFFIGYCIILALCFYLLLYFFYLYRGADEWYGDASLVSKVTGIYFLILPVVFCALWLSEIIPATIHFTVPESVSTSGLFTNPVHVIDLSILLPGIFITGIMLLQRKSLAFMLAPVLLMFFILMDTTIACLALFMVWKGIVAGYLVVYLMAGMASFSLVLLILNLSVKRRSNPFK